jgi:trehalose 6-phosphate synthase
LSRLVVVSNRIADPRRSVATGGLAIGVLGALEKGGGLWFGWSGDINEEESSSARVRTRHGVTFATIDLDERRFDRYYNGFCNNTLWPLFHYTVGLLEYDRANFAAYLEVNALFARKLLPLLGSDDLIWVHDFHLLSLGARLRDARVSRPLGFFLHTPFPSFEVLRSLPVYKELLQDLCAYDVIGFQTARDLNAFKESMTQPEIGAEVMPDGSLRCGARTLRVDVFPIGVDVGVCAGLAETNEHSPQLERVAASLQGRKLLIGVDRLDYSKGLPKRFAAYQRVLETYPTTRRNVVFMQIAPPTRIGVRAYEEIRHELERAAGHINGQFAETDWVPLRYLNRSIDRGTLMAMFRLACIGLVTPVRDGMNLVAKEFVATQDPADPGVLVLSTMAGAAQELQAAILVNPHDIDAVAEGIRSGLMMSIEERRERHAAMIDVLSRNSIEAWRQRFVAALIETDTGPESGRRTMASAARMP